MKPEQAILRLPEPLPQPQQLKLRASNEMSTKKLSPIAYQAEENFETLEEAIGCRGADGLLTCDISRGANKLVVSERSSEEEFYEVTAL